MNAPVLFQQKQEEIRKKGDMERKKLALTVQKRQLIEDKMEKETEEKLETLELKQLRSHRLQ